MGLFDKIKKFAGGAKTAQVEVTEVEGVSPGQAKIKLSDTSVSGKMRVTIQEDCVMLASKAEVVLRTREGEDEEWTDVVVSFGKAVKEERACKAGEVIEYAWTVGELEIARYLRNQEWEDPNDAVGDSDVKLIVRCIADVKGSPFDPQGEAEVALAEQASMGVDITVIEGRPADSSHFPVGDSVLKGTVVVTANEDAVLAATKYEIRLRLNGQDVLVAQDQDPELEPNPLSVSFGGTYIKFPLQMKPGKQATQTWMVSDIDLKAALSSNGFDPETAMSDERVQLIVRCLADAEGAPNVAFKDVRVPLTA